jgi:ferrous iron transport protein B
MNLDEVPAGQPVVLGKTEVNPVKARRLAELGFRAGNTVTPLHRASGGGRVVQVGTARVAVARATLSRIGLRPRHPEPDSAVPATNPAGGSEYATTPLPVAVLAPPTRGGVGCHGDSGGNAPTGVPTIALVGNPNVGKSTLFNVLTGARRQVGNWPGTTVEVGRGGWDLPGQTGALIDLPGTYSLDPISPDERLTRDLLIDASVADRPDLVVVVVSAANAARGLYLLGQVRERGLRAVVALTMSDVAHRSGVSIDPAALAEALGVPVVPVDPRRRRDVATLAPIVERELAASPPGELRYPLSEDPPDEFELADARFTWVTRAVDAASHTAGTGRPTWSDRIDRVATSPVIGPLLFLAVMWAMFQVTTTGAAPLVDGLDRLVSGPVSDGTRQLLGMVGAGGGWVEGLVVDGLIAGVGMVLTFVPLMSLMFVLLAMLEDSGYLARAAVVADRLMRAVGLPGRAFVPLIIGFGCNVPAVSATRVLPDARHRLLTALLVPFTSCSARLPVYVLVAAAIFGENAGNVVFGMYLASVVLVILGGMLLRVTLLRGIRQEPLLLDLPRYQVPLPRMLLSVTWTRLAAFLRTATGVIVVTVIAVWLLTAIPARQGVGGFGEVDPADSAFGAVASALTPVFAPAGFGDWHATGALMVGFVAKEALISSWGQTYAAEEPDDLAAPSKLGEAVRADFDASSGGHTGLVGIAFLLFVLGYTPCVATMTAQVREIGLRWTMTGMALSLVLSWSVAVAVFQIGRMIL